jgi:DNA replication and repair protein RecF
VCSAYVSVAGDDYHAELTNSLSIFGGGSEPDDASGEVERVATLPTDPFTTADIEAAFRSQLAAVRRTELERGVTLVGPHRDDLILGLNRMPARGYASHGESWSFALSLKLASAVLLKRESSLGDPVLILDDVFAELDENRRSRLAEAVKGFAQVLITAAVFDEIPRELTGHTVHIAAGTIVPVPEQLDSPEQEDSTV